jgi:hypothetical protein
MMPRSMLDDALKIVMRGALTSAVRGKADLQNVGGYF